MEKVARVEALRAQIKEFQDKADMAKREAIAHINNGSYDALELARNRIESCIIMQDEVFSLRLEIRKLEDEIDDESKEVL